MRLAGAAIVFLLSLASLPAAGQYTVGKVTFKNPGPYQQGDLEAAAGMHSGQKFSVDDLNTAAQRLSDTGFFDDIALVIGGSNAATEVIFTLKPLDGKQLTPVGFENFVWLTPEELKAALHSAAPLFHGALPDAGTQADAINAALTAALAAKGAHVVVTHATLEPSTRQPMRAVEFRVEQPTVRVRNVSLQGVSPEMAAAVDAIKARMKGAFYNQGLAGGTTESRLLAPYSEAGYLDAKLVGVHDAIAATSAEIVDVDITATLDQGAQYHVASLNFAGTPVVPAAVVSASAKLHAGDVASRRALMETLEPIDVGYRRLGYMDVVVQPGAVLDSSAHTVAYTVMVAAGEQYRMRTINAVGLDPAARADFDRYWLLKPGELYNAEYASGFIKNNTALKSLAPYTASFKASADPQTHEVDLIVTFVRGAGGR